MTEGLTIPGSWEEFKKLAGEKLIDVYQHTQRYGTLTDRVRAYLDRRKQVRNLDQEHIHGFDASPEGGYELRASDLETLLDML